jgi:glycosyltransferase involved in cell wall biosynthesis
MARIGLDVSVYTTNIDGSDSLLSVPLQSPVNIGGVSVTYFPSTFGRNSTWDSKALYRMLEKTVIHFDILYISAIWQRIGISVGRIAKKHRVPYVVGPHGSFDSVLLKKGKVKKMLYWHLFLKQCIRYAGAIHFTTEYERRQSILLRSGYHSFVVPNCMPAQAFQVNNSSDVSLREEFGIAQNVPLILTVARPVPKKRLDILLNAFKNVSKCFPGARLMIVGRCDSAYARRMKALSNLLGLDEKVIWAGYRTGSRLDDCYAGADLFVLPSMDENFGMVVTEAMAAALPVVISNCVGVAEDVERYNAGIVTDVDAQQVARAAIKLLHDRPRLQKMSENARNAVTQLYSGEQVSRLMLKAYEDILTGRRSQQLQWKQS